MKKLINIKLIENQSIHRTSVSIPQKLVDLFKQTYPRQSLESWLSLKLAGSDTRSFCHHLSFACTNLLIEDLM
ncbi:MULTISPECIES: hypothetical protein [Pseudomonas]|uniref:hypothetical protein n=1 Tax=Pseudomonas TaxID=286 RepID=UPI00091F03D4|nr:MULTISPECIES: hypothetical protein [Pseudomonas]SHI35755.1 hypothetical protein SAMN05216295_101365 [Pseudomonas zeshuii]